MSYYEDVYLARLNRLGTTRQERVQGSRARQFETFLPRSNYKINFSYDGTDCMGSLQPAHGDEKDVISNLLTPVSIILPTGFIVEIEDGQKWLVTYQDNNKTLGYNKYKVYLLDRIMTWWTEKGKKIETPITVASSKDKSVSDVFRNIARSPVHREAVNYSNVIMSYDKRLKQDCYCTIDGSPRGLIVSGFDCETVPNVQYVTLDVTMKRDEEDLSTRPHSFWG